MFLSVINVYIRLTLLYALDATLVIADVLTIIGEYTALRRWQPTS